MNDFLQLSGIEKRFAGVYALKGVSMDVRAGEVHCLVGENGSGKSTLIKIISGVQPQDAGSMVVNGKTVEHPTTAEMIHRGIQVIYQDLSLLPNLTVAENIALAEIVRSGDRVFSRAKVRDIATRAMKRIGAKLDLDEIVGDMPVGQQQMVAICRAFTAELKLLILDEPTASLTKSEIDSLLEVVRDMQSRGIAIVFVSHKLNEIVDVADRVTVLRDGAKAGSLDRSELTIEKLEELIAGRALKNTRFYLPRGDRRKILEVRGLTKRLNFADISFDLHEGEILGIVGLIGSGRTELAHALFGIAPADSGEIIVGGQKKDIRYVNDAVKAGLAYVPENRMTQGLVLRRSVGDNLITAIIKRCTRPSGLIDTKKRAMLIDHWIKSLSIKVASPDVPVQTLSGGNQQRVVIGKWLATQPKILILDGPTVGVDIGNKSSIYEIVRELAAQGTGVILISDEVPEVVNNSNRLLLMRGGRIREVLDTENVESDAIQAKVEAA